MKRSVLVFIATMAALLITGCAKTPSVGVNDANVRYFNAWLKKYYPNARKTDPGLYIIEDEPGKGSTLGSAEDNPWLYLEYTSTDLLGNITESTDSLIAKQLGTFNRSNYYGPKIMYRGESSITAGLEAMISDMKKGGKRKAIIPGWLATNSRYNKEESYIKNVTGSDGIYEVKVIDSFADVQQWQIDSIETYLKRNFGQADSLRYGFYYIQTQAPTDTTTLTSDDNVTINYTGMLLNGTVFDTTDEHTAKDFGIYSASSTYEPKKITMSSDYESITMTVDSSSSSLIDGFSYCLSLMRKGEKGTAVFISTQGYSSTAKDAIPAYSPLRFDIEVFVKE